MNEKNLIPISKRTKKEQREITKKGGISSGKKRKKLKGFGLEETNQMLTIVAFFEGLTGKNKISAESYKLLLDILGENKISDHIDPLAKLREYFKNG